MLGCSWNFECSECRNFGISSESKRIPPNVVYVAKFLFRTTELLSFLFSWVTDKAASKLFTSNERNALKCNAFHEKKNTSVAALTRYIYVNIKSALIGPYSVKHRCHTVGMYPQTDVLFVLGIWR